MKKYNSGLELHSPDVNLVLRNTAMILREVPFAKYCPDFEFFLGNHERSVKNDFPGNIPHRSRFQELKKIPFWTEAVT